MGSERVQLETDRRLARDFATSDRSRARGVEPNRVSCLDRARIHQHRVQNGQQGQAERAGRVEFLKYPTDIGRVSSGYQVRNVTRCMPVKLK